MKTLALFGSLVLFATAAVADEKTRAAQAELKNQGFYYGESDGNFGSETSAAIKRFQIRNGLEVTGTLTQQTLEALGLAESTDAAPRAVTPPAAPPAASSPRQEDRRAPVHLRRDSTVEESDRNFLRREDQARTVPNDPSIVSPPAPLSPPLPPGSLEYAQLFAQTPYATAPLELQQSTLRRVQSLLARDGSYRDPVDGIPGPATEEAILSYQRRARLPLTGRLDLHTLNRMRLLPGRGGPPMQPFHLEPRDRHASPSRTFRGIWVE